jgi:putative aldouronate transport system substrate-binding protein
MIKRNLRLLSVILGVALAAGVIAGCNKKAEDTKPADGKSAETASKGPSYLNKTGFPIVKEPLTLKGMVNVSPVQGDYSQIMFWQEYEKMTGIKIDWIQVPSANANEKRNLALASGDLPDFFFRMGIPENDLVKYGAQSTFIKLNDLIPTYAPNFKKVMDSMPDIKKGLPNADGSIYSLPSMTDGLAFEVNPKMFLNKVWLNKLGLKMPGTTEELYSVLKAFKEKDPNGNGKADEIPWSGYALTQVTDTLKGAWGLGNRGRKHPNVDVDESTGKLRFLPITTQYKEMIEYISKLYQEGLIDQEIFTSKSTQLVAKAEQDIVGTVCIVNTAFLGASHENDYEGIPAALKGPKGDQLYAGITARLGAKGAFALTSSNKHPEATLRWIDYLYSDDGIKMFYMGFEGKTYKKTADGKYEFLDEIVNNIPAGSSFDQVISKYVPYAGGSSPTIVKTDFFKGGETKPVSLAATEKIKPYLPKEIWAPFTYTVEETEKRAILENDINSYIDQMIPKFVQGKEPLSKWDDYVAQVKKMGLDDYMKIYEAAYERYKKN